MKVLVLKKRNRIVRMTCPICLEAVKTEERQTSLDCRHCFHTFCFYEYLISTSFHKSKPCCPYCRRVISKEISIKHVVDIINILKNAKTSVYSTMQSFKWNYRLSKLPFRKRHISSEMFHEKLTELYSTLSIINIDIDTMHKKMFEIQRIF